MKAAAAASLFGATPLASTDNHCARRVFIGILDGRLIAMDGKTGKSCTGFGEDGQIDLSRDARLRQRNYVDYNLTSPPIVVGERLGDNKWANSIVALRASTGQFLWGEQLSPTQPMPTQVTLAERETYEELAQTELAEQAQFTAQAGTPYGMWRRPLLSMLGTPCSEPPWGQINAVDMREGKILWQGRLPAGGQATPRLSSQISVPTASSSSLT